MEYKKCLVELDEILNMLSKEDLDKIPNDIKEAIKEQKDTNYIWNYDSTKSLSNQKLDRQTVAMLAYINMQYLVNSEQKALLEDMHKFNEQKLEKEKAEKYNSEELFKERNNTNTEQNKNVMMIEIKKEKWYKRFFSNIIKLFKRK